MIILPGLLNVIRTASDDSCGGGLGMRLPVDTLYIITSGNVNQFLAHIL